MTTYRYEFKQYKRSEKDDVGPGEVGPIVDIFVRSFDVSRREIADELAKQFADSQSDHEYVTLYIYISA